MSFNIDGFQTICKIDLTLSYTQGQSSGRRLKKKVGKLKPYSAGFAGQGSVLRLAGSADILTLWSCQIRALPQKAGNVERPPAIRVYLSVQPPRSPERSHPAPPPASPRPPQLLPAPQRRAGRRLGRLAEPRLTGRRGRRPKRAGEAAASSSRCLGGVVRGQCSGLVGSGPPGRRRFSPDRCVLARRPQNQTGTRLPRNPLARFGPQSWWSRRAPGAKPASSPSPICGARPRGREQGGEMGSSPPQPLPFLHSAQTKSRPCPSALFPAQADATRRSKAIGKSPALLQLPPDP